MNYQNFISSNLIESSIKQKELDRILDKISGNETITPQEKDFLDKFPNDSLEFVDPEIHDFMMLSNESASIAIRKLLNTGEKIICNLTDRDGKIGMEILDIKDGYNDDYSEIILKNQEEIKMKDSFLYNIIYNQVKDEYSLEEEGEYFEKLPIKRN